MPSRRVFASVTLVIMLGSLEKSIITTPLPVIGRELMAGPGLTWIVTSYLLAATAALPLYGKLSDLYGRVRLLNLAITLFLLGSIACALAQNLPQLLGARVLQGIGGGGLIALAFTIIADTIPPREVGRYQAYISAVYAVSSIAGPLLGGYCAEHLSWRLIFWINLPLGALALWLVNRYLGHLNVRRHSRFDWKGAALLVIATTLTLLLLSPEHTLPPLWLAAALAAALTLLVLVERSAHDPILPAQLARRHDYLVSLLLILVAQLLMFALLLYLPLQLQWEKGLGAADSGRILIIFMFSITAGAFAGGRLISRFGHYKGYVVTGFSLAALGLWQIQGGCGMATGLIATGLGLGLVIPALSVVAQNRLTAGERGIGLSLLSFGRELGGAVGVAIGSSLLHLQLPPGPLTDFTPTELAAGFSTTYAGMVLIALGALAMTLLTLRQQELTTQT
ncbi:EmrB/QacA family drug resistance transporter [Aeromonas diversa CDC 2478-85]|uniref:EmrB/QacA family drug resistance transporter n=1 Tax=Aeromonas diversa CDC 2478-85 TaxID=1268237 RepID=N9V989_9GAMM|nr:MFS transporter [Aeromonas diversa]ENY71842.1 EmrB/QacA family drug resistance transporter [Aeromonas diversa CDC 2478-85]